MHFRLTILPILVLVGMTAYAQRVGQPNTTAQQDVGQQEANCQAKLSDAENNFVAGKFYGIPSLLQSCLDDGGFSREEQVRVYMLLSQVYLLTDDPSNAEASYLKLLAADPEFVANETVDPIDVVYLSKKFTTTPIFTPHIKVGPNISTQSIVGDESSVSTPGTTKTQRGPLPGISVGGGIEWNINDNLGIGGEALFSYKAFQTTTTGIFGNNVVNVRERQLWADFPFYVRYGSNIGKFRPYGYAGYAVNLLFADYLNLVYTVYSKPDPEKPAVVDGSVQGSDPNVMYKRNLLNGSVVLGGGIKYKFGKNFLLVDLRYMGGLKSVVNRALNHYADGDDFELTPEPSRYTYVGPLFRVNSYSLSFGFVRPLYNPRKLAKANTKGVSRKISRE